MPVDTGNATAAIILAGGRARRFDGDKLAAEVAGRSLLDRAIDAADGRPIVVVGARRGADRPGIRWTTEDPPYGGPVAGIAAGVALLDADVQTVLVLAGDQPFLHPGLLSELCAAVDAATPVALVEADGHRQLLTSAWSLPVLRRRLAELGEPDGVSVRRLIGTLRAAIVTDPAPAGRALSFDVDTRDDLERARGWVQ